MDEPTVRRAPVVISYLNRRSIIVRFHSFLRFLDVARFHLSIPPDTILYVSVTTHDEYDALPTDELVHVHFETEESSEPQTDERVYRAPDGLMYNYPDDSGRAPRHCPPAAAMQRYI
jgi:hypothetical protein